MEARLGIRSWIAIVAIAAGVLQAPVLARQKAGYQEVSFYDISNYSYDPKDPWAPEPKKMVGTIPPSVMKLNGQKIAIVGTMTPLDYDPKGGSAQFILAISQDSCGFGATPRINEWIMVTMAPGKRAPYAYSETEIRGTFEIKEEVVNGLVTMLYRMVGDAAD